MTQRVDFDDYAERYEGLLKDQLAFFSADRGYFSDYKAACMRGEVQRPVSRILDFGCGIGLTLPYLRRHFPQASLSATDISAKSLEHVQKSVPDVEVIADSDLDQHRFDLILVAGVIHHVPPDERPGVFKRLANLLSRDGELFVFEHNPFNPVTRRLVSTCPFDTDAQIISRRALSALMRSTGALATSGSGYCLFFPERLQAMRPLEKGLRWLPLGGQYFVRATKT
jgi:2-polyprenyl-3-methyl-5-hydroxy-6-metoxy-1,4-benzoquinol methylase